MSPGRTLRLRKPKKYVVSPLYGSLGTGLSDISHLRIEIDLYKDWLLRRVPAPGAKDAVGDYHETATAVYARCKEMEMLIQRQEADGQIPRGSAYYRFRTGELRSFLELAKACFERGSRQITEAQLALEAMRAGI